MEILYSEPITEAPKWLVFVFAIAVIIICVGIFHANLRDGWAGLLIMLLSTIVAILSFFAIIITSEYCKTNRTHYEVILDEDYPVSKLYEDYIVKEQRGKIWILEDKEASE